MTPQQILQRAITFAHRIANLNRFLVSDKVTKELYGYTFFVVDTPNLQRYYEHHEPNPVWRNWPAFLAEIERRVEQRHVVTC